MNLFLYLLCRITSHFALYVFHDKFSPFLMSEIRMSKSQECMLDTRKTKIKLFTNWENKKKTWKLVLHYLPRNSDKGKVKLMKWPLLKTGE